MKINENKIHKLLLENAHSLLKFLSVTASEFVLISATDLLNRDIQDGYKSGKVIGKIDLILHYHTATYITEIKYDEPTNTSSDFWNSLKVLGYTEYYKWQTGITNVHPAIIVPLHSIKLEQQIIAGKLGIKIFAVYEQNGEIKIKTLDDRPVWKQK